MISIRKIIFEYKINYEVKFSINSTLKNQLKKIRVNLG